MESKHNKLPFYLSEDELSIYSKVDGIKRVVVSFPDNDEGRADAQFILQACNLHYINTSKAKTYEALPEKIKEITYDIFHSFSVPSMQDELLYRMKRLEKIIGFEYPEAERKSTSFQAEMELFREAIAKAEGR